MVWKDPRRQIFSFSFLRERGKGGRKEGEKHQCVRETSISCLSHASQLRTKPTTQACALTGDQTCDLSIFRTMPNQLSHSSQGRNPFFIAGHHWAPPLLPDGDALASPALIPGFLRRSRVLPMVAMVGCGSSEAFLRREVCGLPSQFWL